MKQKHFIDTHKGATSIFVLGLMAFYEQWENTTLWLYLATHGLYGILWVIKSMTFGDRNWEQRCGIGYGMVIWGGLSLYWIAPWLIASQGMEAPAWLQGLCVTSFGAGIFFHFVSDMQKHIKLSLAPGLLTEGLWARCRNPNYFGELLIYAGFSGLAMSWIPYAVLTVFLGAVWIPNMVKKDRSLSRYPEFEAYKARSGILIPFIL